MNRLLKRLVFALLPGLMLGLLLTGCGGKKSDDDDDGPSVKRSKSGKTGSATQTASLQPVKATEYGTIRGEVKWSGAKPDFDAVTKNLQSEMAKKDAANCLNAPDIKPYETSEQGYRIGKNDGLGNVFVWIVPEKDHYFDVPADQLAKFKDTLVVISQPHCAFLPHASVVFPYVYKDGKLTPTGQKLEVENDAKVSHNSKVGGTALNPGSDQLLSPHDKKTYTLKPDKTPITISCGVHTWMKGYIRAYDHPYAAVTSVGGDVKAKKYEDDTSPQFGKYEITGVPVGAKVHLVAWHEELGYLAGDTGREVTLKKENMGNDFNFEAKAK